MPELSRLPLRSLETRRLANGVGLHNLLKNVVMRHVLLLITVVADARPKVRPPSLACANDIGVLDGGIVGRNRTMAILSDVRHDAGPRNPPTNEGICSGTPTQTQ